MRAVLCIILCRVKQQIFEKEKSERCKCHKTPPRGNGASHINTKSGSSRNFTSEATVVVCCCGSLDVVGTVDGSTGFVEKASSGADVGSVGIIAGFSRFMDTTTGLSRTEKL